MHYEGMNSFLRSCRAGAVAVSVTATMIAVTPAVTASAATTSPTVSSAVPWTVDKGRVVVTVKKRAPKAKVAMTQPVTVLMTDSGLSAAALTCKAKGKAVTVKRAKKKTRKKLRRSCRTTIQRHVAAVQPQPSPSPGDVQQMSPVADDPGMAGFTGEWTYENAEICSKRSVTLGNNSQCKELLHSHVDLVISDPDPNYPTCQRYGIPLRLIHIQGNVLEYIAGDEYDAVVTCRRLDTYHDGTWAIFIYEKGAADYLATLPSPLPLNSYDLWTKQVYGELLPAGTPTFKRADCAGFSSTTTRLASDSVPTIDGFRQYLTQHYSDSQQRLATTLAFLDNASLWLRHEEDYESRRIAGR